MKRAVERLMGSAFLAGLYRPLYAATSTSILLWLWVMPHDLKGDANLIELTGVLRILPLVAKGGAVLLIAVCFRDINFWEFIGTAQFGRWLSGETKNLAPTEPEDFPLVQQVEPLAMGGLYLWVRHPLNTAAFLWIWAQQTYTFHSVTFAACLTIYILIGNRFEERDLIKRYGASYERYRETVPSFIGGIFGISGRAKKLRDIAVENPPPS
ncbi:MAG: isoprenylcysteine carboxylmethyltransferase family protein [Nitrospinaceae bacterium]|nr:isoprenylcysteine carboxylmethyltransferase family protein [Nitrospinaceae bacterium]MBT5369572.1 isoprenylcysteine carboxylmethyltransferase family protein [Nitrospinaceae bacterium]MBT5946471.1 isoprenylcysteine carboxylmethyltransferase family protein [Nitrospinaceae bacterium]MBT6395377.1 isoprenylcysteine carboxylmethyltransferase family protein [Nitrospinaceae bacterium]MBT7856775.1 isoprenylcysteine carboxylmethyltransferase family protein [Nitrospinaceae bacterium]